MKYILVIGGIVVCALVGVSTSATAQIQSWGDGAGVLTLSDRPQNAATGGVQVRVGTPMGARSNPLFEPLIQQHARQNGVRADLVRAVIQVESAFNPASGVPEGRNGADAADAGNG